VTLHHLLPSYRAFRSVGCSLLLAAGSLLAAEDVPAPPAPDTCSEPVLRLLREYRALTDRGDSAHGDLITTLEDALITSPQCIARLTAVTVSVLDGEPSLVRQALRCALELAPTEAAAIVAAARDASRRSDDVIAETSLSLFGTDFRPEPPPNLQPTSGLAAAAPLSEPGPTAVVGPASPEPAEPPAPARLPATDPVPAPRFPTLGLAVPDSGPGTALLVPDPASAPWEVTVSLGAGFDSNVATAPEATGSAFITAGLGAKLRRTLDGGGWEADVQYRHLDHFQEPAGFREATQLGSLDFRWGRRLANRWLLTEEFGLLRDTEPDFASGWTTSLRQPAYLTVGNRLALALEVNPLWTVQAGHGFAWLGYADRSGAAAEERLTQRAGLESRHLLWGETAASLAYQADFTDFSRSPLDFTRHGFLASVNSPLPVRDFHASLGAGAQLRRGGSGGSRDTPWTEFSLDGTLPTGTATRWTHRFGQLDQELALLGFGHREGHWSQFSAAHPLTDHWTVEGSAGVLTSRLSSPGDPARPALDETALTANLGLVWELAGDLRFNAGYHFVRLDSPAADRAYDRHQVGLGVHHSF